MVSGGITPDCGRHRLAGAAGTLPMAASGMGRKSLNACILGVEVLMLGWHTLMSRHGREMPSTATVGRNIAYGACAGVDCSHRIALRCFARDRRSCCSCCIAEGAESGQDVAGARPAWQPAQ